MPAAVDFHGDGRVEGVVPKPGLFGTCTACDGRIKRGIRRDGRIVMAHISGEVTIDALVEEVFDLVADERNEPRYDPRIVHAAKLSEGPVGRGSRFVGQPKGMGSKGRMTLEIVEHERPHRLHNIVGSSYMEVDGTLTFEEADGGTRLR
jgi:uncharacterized protein YndB with AHSA1/START domain